MLKRGIHLKGKDIKPNSIPKFVKIGVEKLALLESAIETKEDTHSKIIEGVTPTQD